ncbi:MAG: hypothetical protein Q8M32_13295 [Brevundimonas sp.]|nr:hypothetical protein [Brevundimonas sp.]
MVHLRNNRDFALDDLIELEAFLCDQDVLGGVEFDGHDYGADDSNIFLFSDELENTVDLLARFIESTSRELNFAVGAKAEGAEADYAVIVCKGIYEIIMQ